MTGFLTAAAKRRGVTALYALAVVGLATSLAGCYRPRMTQEVYPNDYRERHPITLKERERTVEVFVGRNRGGLTPSQRADVLSFAQVWRREATSGIIVDVPRGGPTDRAAADSVREVNSILAASGVPRNAIYVHSYEPPESALASIKIRATRPMRVPIDTALAALERRTMRNGFLLMALQWLALHRDRLDAIIAGPPAAR